MTAVKGSVIGARLAPLVVVAAASGTAAGQPALALPPEVVAHGWSMTSEYALDGGPPGEVQIARIRLQSTGTTAVAVTGMVIAGPGASAMAFADPVCGTGLSCATPFSIPAGVTNAVELQCIAPAVGPVAPATLTVTSDAPGSPTAIAITCTGNNPPVMALSPPGGLDFGVAHWCEPDDGCGSTCATQPLDQTLTITNTAAAPSTLEVAFTPPLVEWWETDANFTLPDGQCHPEFPCRIPAGESRNIRMIYRPLAGGPSEYGPLTLTITYPGVAPVSYPFHAEQGFGAPEPGSPELLGAGPVGVPIIAPVTVHNAGNSCLFLHDIHLAASDPGVVAIPPFAGDVLLQAGESVTQMVSCTPQQVGHWTAGELAYDVAWENTDFGFQGFYCLGIGGALATVPGGSLGFGEIDVGAPTTRRIAVRNHGNTATDLVAMTSTDPQIAATLVAGSLPLTIEPEQAIEVDVTISPAASGEIVADLVFDGSIGDDATLIVYATAVVAPAPAVAVDPLAIDLGTVEVGATITLTSLGDGPIVIENQDPRATYAVAAIELTGDAAYRLIGGDPADLAPGGGQLTADLELHPTRPGVHIATIAVYLDGSLEPLATIDVTALAVAAPPPDEDPDDDGGGCASTAPGAGAAWLVLLLVLGLAARIRARPRA